MVTFSIGVAMYPNNGEDSNTLIKNTDVAMYKAKCNGDNKVQGYYFFKPISKEKMKKIN